MTDEFGEDVLVAAAWQRAQEFDARAIHARGCGLALIQLTEILESEDATLDPAVDPLGIVLIACAARSRRLLRAAYMLLDTAHAPEAAPLLRVLSEYVIVARWLYDHPGGLRSWVLRDHGKRELTIRNIMDTLGPSDPVYPALAKQLDELQRVGDVFKAAEGLGDEEEMPRQVEVMAEQIGAEFAYQLGYRTQSHADVHVTPLAVDSCYEQLPDGRLRLLPASVHSLSQYDQYELGAHLLRDVFAVTAAHLPNLMWRSGIEGITAALNESRKSDPRHRASVGEGENDRGVPD